MALDKIELMDDAVAVGMANNMEQCQAKVKTSKSSNNFAKFIIENMHDLFKIQIAMENSKNFAQKFIKLNILNSPLFSLNKFYISYLI
jgi:hypothetical protein